MCDINEPRKMLRIIKVKQLSKSLSSIRDRDEGGGSTKYLKQGI